MAPALFYPLAVLAVISALGVIAQRNPIHCLLSLVLTLLTIGVLFIGEDATVVGFLQIIVYAGAIMVLFLFVIWLLNVPLESGPRGQLALRFFGSIATAALVGELMYLLSPARSGGVIAQMPAEYGTIDSLSQKLFGEYLIAFEVTSLLLLVAVIGAVALARRAPATASPAPTSMEKI